MFKKVKLLVDVKNVFGYNVKERFFVITIYEKRLPKVWREGIICQKL